MRLTAGQNAVAFTATAIDGTTVSLSQFAGRPVLLMFFRYAACPMCNLRLHEFARSYTQLRARGLEVIAVFHSPAESIRAHAGGRRYPFSLVADPTFHVYRLYGVETSWGRLLLSIARPRFYVDWLRSMRHGFWGGAAWQMGMMPADFLIGPDGRIALVHYGADIGDHLPIARVEAFVHEHGGAPSFR